MRKKIGQVMDTEGNLVDIKMVPARKKPIIIYVGQVNFPFSVSSLEGELYGEAGDWLAIGVEGEPYIIAKHIFEKTYDLVKEV